jgi:RNA polymerase sigma-54 factor
MQRALHLLKLPLVELAEEVSREVDENPLLEMFETFGSPPLNEGWIEAKPTLFEHLMEQATQVFEDERSLEIAEAIIGNVDNRGFFSESLDFSDREVSGVLEVIKTFDPVGIGAKDVRECLLIQLKKLGRPLAFQIVDKHFNNLLQNDIPLISKGLKMTPSQVEALVKQEIAPLTLSPACQFSTDPTPYIRPDVTIVQGDASLSIDIKDDLLPDVGWNYEYLKLLEDSSIPEEEKGYIRDKVGEAKWLFRSLSQRKQTLLKVVSFLVERHQRFFLSPNDSIKPLKMKEVAEAIAVHESTITRAVSGKYLECSRGLFPLRAFFSTSFAKEEEASVSSTEIKERIKVLIAAEDKQKPLSDEKIAKLLQGEGLEIARRTVAKFRQQLMLGNAKERRCYG